MKRIDRITKSPDFSHLLEQARRHSAAKDRREHLQAEQSRIPLRYAGHRQCDMNLFEILRFDTGTANEFRRLRRRRSRTAELGKSALNLVDNGLMIDGARGGNDHIGRTIIARQIRRELPPIDRAHAFARTQYGASDRLVRKCRYLQLVEY